MELEYKIHFISFASLTNPGAYSTLYPGLEEAQIYQIKALEKYLAELKDKNATKGNTFL